MDISASKRVKIAVFYSNWLKFTCFVRHFSSKFEKFNELTRSQDWLKHTPQIRVQTPENLLPSFKWGSDNNFKWTIYTYTKRQRANENEKNEEKKNTKQRTANEWTKERKQHEKIWTNTNEKRKKTHKFKKIGAINITAHIITRLS